MKRHRRKFIAVLALTLTLTLTGILTGCSPAEVKQWYATGGIELTDQQAADVATWLNAQPPRARFASTGTVWDRLAKCESGGNWAINTGNGYTGGLQFADSTWRSNGGAQFAPRAFQATREEQITVAQRLHSKAGFAPWPGCRAKLGLR